MFRPIESQSFCANSNKQSSSWPEHKPFSSINQPQERSGGKHFFAVNQSLEQLKIKAANQLNAPQNQIQPDSFAESQSLLGQIKSNFDKHSAKDFVEPKSDFNDLSDIERKSAQSIHMNKSKDFRTQKSHKNSSIEFKSSDNKQSSKQGLNYSFKLSEVGQNSSDKIPIPDIIIKKLYQSQYSSRNERSSWKNPNDGKIARELPFFNVHNISFFQMKQLAIEQVSRLSQSSMMKFSGNQIKIDYSMRQQSSIISSQNPSAFVSKELKQQMNQNEQIEQQFRQYNFYKKSQPLTDKQLSPPQSAGIFSMQKISQLPVNQLQTIKNFHQAHIQLCMKYMQQLLKQKPPKQVIVQGQKGCQNWFMLLEFAYSFFSLSFVNNLRKSLIMPNQMKKQNDLQPHNILFIQNFSQEEKTSSSQWIKHIFELIMFVIKNNKFIFNLKNIPFLQFLNFVQIMYTQLLMKMWISQSEEYSTKQSRIELEEQVRLKTGIYPLFLFETIQQIINVTLPSKQQPRGVVQDHQTNLNNDILNFLKQQFQSLIVEGTLPDPKKK